MSSQTSGGEAVPPSPRTAQRTLLDDLILTFTSPMAWLLVVALVITWSGVAIVLFDLLDYKTLAGLPPPPAIAKRAFKARVCKIGDNREMTETEITNIKNATTEVTDVGGVRPIKSSSAGAPGEVTAQEGTDWLELLWSLAASLVAPDEEEEGIHQLSETLTSFHSEEL